MLMVSETGQVDKDPHSEGPCANIILHKKASAPFDF